MNKTFLSILISMVLLCSCNNESESQKNTLIKSESIIGNNSEFLNINADNCISNLFKNLDNLTDDQIASLFSISTFTKEETSLPTNMPNIDMHGKKVTLSDGFSKITFDRYDDKDVVFLELLIKNNTFESCGVKIGMAKKEFCKMLGYNLNDYLNEDSFAMEDYNVGGWGCLFNFKDQKLESIELKSYPY